MAYCLTFSLSQFCCLNVHGAWRYSSHLVNKRMKSHMLRMAEQVSRSLILWGKFVDTLSIQDCTILVPLYLPEKKEIQIINFQIVIYTEGNPNWILNFQNIPRGNEMPGILVNMMKRYQQYGATSVFMKEKSNSCAHTHITHTHMCIYRDRGRNICFSYFLLIFNHWVLRTSH